MKLNALREVLDGKRVVVVDDSIVRGTTSRKIVHMLRAGGGARGAHADQLAADDEPLLLRHRHADARGADRLVAHGRGDRASIIGADSLAYLSEAGLYAFNGGDATASATPASRGRVPGRPGRRGAEPASCTCSRRASGAAR